MKVLDIHESTSTKLLGLIIRQSLYKRVLRSTCKLNNPLLPIGVCVFVYIFEVHISVHHKLSLCVRALCVYVCICMCVYCLCVCVCVSWICLIIR